MNAQPKRGYISMLFRRSITVAVLVAGTAVAAAQPAPQAPPPAPPVAPPAELPTASIRGRVIDAYGKPIAGARVTSDGESSSATTERDGSFQISARIGTNL